VSQGCSTLSAASGWTQLYSWSAPNGTLIRAYWHLVTAGDSSVTQWTWTCSGTAPGYATDVAAYGGVNAAAPIHASAMGTATSGTTLTLPSVTLTVDRTLVALLLADDRGNTTWTLPAGWTERADSTGVANGDRAFPTATATQSQTVTTSSSAGRAGFVIALAPGN
jgi:hypothetical protein